MYLIKALSLAMKAGEEFYSAAELAQLIAAINKTSATNSRGSLLTFLNKTPAGKVGEVHFMAKITIKKLESLTVNDAGSANPSRTSARQTGLCTHR
jgi:hypothetical protein